MILCRMTSALSARSSVVSSAMWFTVLWASTVMAAGRFDSFTARFAKTPDQAAVVAATLVGGAGTEWLCGGGFAPDGTVVTAGTCLGPSLEIGGVRTVVLGTDNPAPPAPQQKPVTDRSGRPQLDKDGKPRLEPFSWRHENATGFVVRLSPDARKVLSVTRLPWKSAAITSAAVDAEGCIYIAGPYSDGAALRSITSDARAQTAGAEGADKASCQRVYLAKLAPAADKALWVRMMEGASACPRVRIDKAGRVIFTGPDYRIFKSDGSVELAKAVPGGLEGHVAVNPVDGTYARGGEHHWPTGREPWRCPTLNIFRPDGQLLYQLYDWGGPYVGLDNLRLVSDTAIRGVMYDDEGNLIIHAWSDGGNSVAVMQPNDIRRPHGAFARGLKMDLSGANVLSAAYILRIETANYKVVDGTVWVAYHPTTTKPNSIWIEAFALAADGSMCIAGRSASGLIRTGNAIGGGQPAGPYVAVLSRRFDSLRFCSNLPGCGKTQVWGDEEWGIASGMVGGKARVMFLSGAVAKEAIYDEELAPPAVNPAQAGFGGGHTDGHIVVLEL